MHICSDERNYESRRYRHTADELLNRLYFWTQRWWLLLHVIVRLVITSENYTDREVDILQVKHETFLWTHEKIISSREVRPN